MNSSFYFRGLLMRFFSLICLEEQLSIINSTIVFFRRKNWNPYWTHNCCNINRLEGNGQWAVDIGHLCWWQDCAHTRWCYFWDEACLQHKRHPRMVHTHLPELEPCRTLVSLFNTEWAFGSLGLLEWWKTCMQENACRFYWRIGVEQGLYFVCHC